MAPSFARGHAERRCSGARPQQARPPRPSPSGKGRSTGCALDLDRANAAPGSYVEVPAFEAGSLGCEQITAQILSRHGGRAFELIMLACCCLSWRLPGLLPLGVRADAAACQMPTLRGCWACLR